jgi:hypothetical protein
MVTEENTAPGIKSNRATSKKSADLPILYIESPDWKIDIQIYGSFLSFLLYFTSLLCQPKKNDTL